MVVGAASASRAAERSSEAGEYACAQAWAALTAAHAQIAGLLASALGRQCDLTINEFEILLRLGRASEDGPRAALRLGELQSAVPLTQPALSRAVARMAG